MAEQDFFNVAGVITIYLYVNKQTGEVEDVTAYTPFGMTRRADKVWVPMRRTDEKLMEYINSGNYETYSVDWEADDVKAKDLDPEDEEAWEPILVQIWDKGAGIPKEDLDKYAKLVDSGDVEERQEPELPEEE